MKSMQFQFKCTPGHSCNPSNPDQYTRSRLAFSICPNAIPQISTSRGSTCSCALGMTHAGSQPEVLSHLTMSGQQELALLCSMLMQTRRISSPRSPSALARSGFLPPAAPSLSIPTSTFVLALLTCQSDQSSQSPAPSSQIPPPGLTVATFPVLHAPRGPCTQRLLPAQPWPRYCRISPGYSVMEAENFGTGEDLGRRRSTSNSSNETVSPWRASSPCEAVAQASLGRTRCRHVNNGFNAVCGSSSSSYCCCRGHADISSSSGGSRCMRYSHNGFGACWPSFISLSLSSSSSSNRGFAATSSSFGSRIGSHRCSSSSGKTGAGVNAKTWGGGGSSTRKGDRGREATLGSVPTGNHYEVLEVARGASLEVIKAAFRQRAKELHPDVLAARAKARRQQAYNRRQLYQDEYQQAYEDTVEQSASAFLRIVAAYETLSNPSSRRAYDIHLAAAAAAAAGEQGSQSGFGAAAAAAGPARAQEQQAGRGRAGGCTTGSRPGSGSNDLRHVDFRSWRYGVGEWMTRTRREPVAGRAATLEYYLRKYSHEFESQLHAALVHAYLGPRLDLQPGELPRCFEADVRRHPGASDQLMQLVSGRTLLGIVRVKELLRLEPAPGSATAASLPPPPPPPGAAAAEAEATTTATAGGRDATHGARSMRTASGLDTVPRGSILADFPRVSSDIAKSNLSSYNVAATAVEQEGVEGKDGEERVGVAREEEKAATTVASRPQSGRVMAGGGGDGEHWAKPMAFGSAIPSSTAAVAEYDIGSRGASATAATLASMYGRTGGGSGGTGDGIDPLEVLDAAAIRGLPDDAVVQLAAAAIARSDAATSGYGHLVPSYSRLRGLLELQGFYPDPAVLQRRSMQISLVTAAEAAQARDSTRALGGRRLMDRWRPNSHLGLPTRMSGGGGGGGDNDDDGAVTMPSQVAATAAGLRKEGQPSVTITATGWSRRRDDLIAEVTPPQQLQGLVEAARVAEAETAAAAVALNAEAAAVAAAATASAAGSRRQPAPPAPPPNSPRTWLFGPDVDGTDFRGDDGYGSSGGCGTTVLEMRLGQDLVAFAVHQLPKPSSPASAAAAAAAADDLLPDEDISAFVRRQQDTVAVSWMDEQRGEKQKRHPGRQRGFGAGSDIQGLLVENTPKPNGAPPPPPPEGSMVPLFGPVLEGRVKVYVNGRLEAGVEGCHVYDTDGHRVALIVRGSFPGLRTIHFFSIHRNPHDTKQRLRLLCRCVRARLLPSPTWLFPPREDTHDVGGWYFEWGGYSRRSQPGWLDPSVFVFVAGIVAAEQERISAAQRQAVSELVQGWRKAAWQAVAGWWGNTGRDR